MIKQLGRLGPMPLLAVLLFSHPLNPQAYCALRDPASAIHSFYPENTGYRSIVRVVSRKAREAVADDLHFTLHFSEIGKHTLYVPLLNQVPIGLVHVRSEKGKWGLVEIAWALDFDLRIQNFRFQRCRNRDRTSLETPAFSQQLVGKSLEDLKAMMSEDGQSLQRDKLQLPTGTEALALTVLRSAVKTIAVTRAAWSQDLGYLRVLRRAGGEFDRASNVKAIAPIYTSRLREILIDLSQEKESVIARRTVQLYAIGDEEDGILGMMIHTGCYLTGGDPFFLWWAVDSTGKIASITPEDGAWPDEETRDIFRSTMDLRLDDTTKCTSPAALAAAEVLAIVKAHQK